MELRILGPVTVVADDGQEHVLGVTREAALLADLVVHAGEVMSAGRLIDDLWRGAPTAGAGATLQTYVKNLRRLLEGASSAAAVCVVRTVRPGYVAELHPDVVDAFRAERMIAEGRRAVYGGDVAEGLRHLAGAIALWRGPAFGDLRSEAYVQAEAARLDELRLGALEALIDAELALGRHVEAAGRLDGLVGEHPYRERFWAQLMVALARSGRQAEALRAYQRVRRLLGDDLGLEPSAELRDLEQAILLGEPTLGSAAVAGGELGVVGAPRTHRRFDVSSPLTRFVGRTAERRAIAQQLTASRLVTLTGMGGVGKTRLALEVAADVQDDYADGVWLFELAPARSEPAVLTAVTAAFGLTLSELAPPVEQICRYLAGRRALLLFDNCEHVLDAVAGLVETILGEAPGVGVLATSRELLRVPGEVTVAVPPLGLPDESSRAPADVAASEAVELFCDRAREARSEFVLAEDDAPVVAEICRRLEGIPLALELAAARLRMLSVGQVAARLGDCFALLTGGARTAAPRQQALRATLDWSYDLLSAAEQAALRSLSVFPDRFDIDAALGVIVGSSGPGDTHGLDLVGQLVDKSFVVAERGGDEVRYRLLEPVRQYATEKLSDAGEDQAARRRHRDVFVARSPSSASDLLEWVSPRPGGDRANFQATLEFSWQEADREAALMLAVRANSRLHGGEIEGRQWLERVVALPEPAEHPARVEAEVVLAQILNESRQPDPTRSRQLIAHALDLAQRVRDPLLVAWTQFTAAGLQIGWGRTGEGVAGLLSAAEVFEAHGLPVSAGWCHERLGWAAIGAGDQQAARTDFERAVELAGHGNGSPLLMMQALASLAPVAMLAGDRRQGQQASDEALAIARRLDVRSGLHMALVRSAETAVLAGSYAEATVLLDELLGLLRDQDSRRWVAETIELVALVLDAHLALHDEAGELLAASALLRTEAGEQIGGTRIVAQAVQALSDRLPPSAESADPHLPQEPGSPRAVNVRAEELLRSAQRTSQRP